jgi:hypothetical protein
MRSITLDDTVAAVRGTFVVVVGAFVALEAACSGTPSLAVNVTNPSGLGVVSTEVSVYQSDALACSGVVFGDLDSEQLATLDVADETIGSGHVTGSLDGMSRTDNKVIVARGFDGSGDWLAAGCVEVGVITDNDSVTIVTEPTVDVSLGLPAVTSGTSGSNSDEYAVVVATTDPTGTAVANRQVSWTVYGAAGTTPANSPTFFDMLDDGEWRPNVPSCTATQADPGSDSEGSGTIVVHPMPPNLVGGYAVQMRVEWANAPIPLFTSLSSLSHPGETPLNPAGIANHYCAVHVTAGSQRIACATEISGNNVVLDLTASANDGAVALGSAGSANLPNNAIALYSVPDGSNTDVYAVDSSGNVTSVFPAGSQVPPGNLPLGTVLDDAIFAPGCNGGVGHLIVHGTNTLHPLQADTIAILDAIGGNAQVQTLTAVAATKSELVSAGCVTELDGGSAAVPIQVVVVDVGEDSKTGTFELENTLALYDCAGDCSVIDLFPGAGVGFTTGAESHMIATTADAFGVELEQVVLAHAGTGADHLVERSSIASASLPDHIVVGNFDDDGQPDQLWDLVAGKRANTSGVAFEVAYAKLITTSPLEALSGTIPDTSVDDLLVEDLNGDGIDDIVVTSTTLGAQFLSAVLLGVPVTAPVSPDATASGSAACP